MTSVTEDLLKASRPDQPEGVKESLKQFFSDSLTQFHIYRLFVNVQQSQPAYIHTYLSSYLRTTK